MQVRDRTKSVKEYKGRLTDAAYENCPCRPCWNAHDCGYYSSGGKRITDMQCATRHISGCPDPKPSLIHIIRIKTNRLKMGREIKCHRCGEKIIYGKVSTANIADGRRHYQLDT